MINTANIPFKEFSQLGFGETYQPPVYFGPDEAPKTNCCTFITTIMSTFSKACQKIKNIFISIFHKKTVQSTTNLMDREIKEIQKDSANLGKWISHNDVLVTQSAKQTNDWKLDLIQSAKQTIEISGNLCGGEVFRECLLKIEEQIEKVPNLQVRILLSSTLLEKDDKKLLKTLQKNHPNNFHYLISGWYLHGVNRLENHVKAFIVDEQYVIVGGTNIQDRLCQEASPESKPKGALDNILGHGSCDMDVVVKGPVTKPIRREFFKLYALHEKYMKKTKTLVNHYIPIDDKKEIISGNLLKGNRHLAKNVKIKAFVGGWENKRNAITEAYAEMIQKADESLTFAQMYFHPHKIIKTALDETLKQDIPVTLVTAGRSTSAPMANQAYAYANALYYPKILTDHPQNKVFEYDNKNNVYGKNIYHKKVAVSKREKLNPKTQKKKEALTMIGSYNMGGLSHLNHELNLMIKSDKVGNEVLKVIIKDSKKGQEILLNDAKTFHHTAKSIFAKVQRALFPAIFD